LTARTFRVLGLCAWLVPAAVGAQPEAVPAPAAAPVRHELSFPQRRNQYVHLRSTWPVADAAVELAMPSWTPGSYLIRDFAANVESLQARSGEGRPLEAVKSAKNRWRILAPETDTLTVEYDVWAGELNVAGNWVEPGFALLNGAGIFLYSESSRGRPQELRVQLPDDWPQLATPLPAAGGAGSFRAANYDELIDSPIVAGALTRRDFRVDGQAYALVLAPGSHGWDVLKSVQDLAKVIEINQAFWGANPLDREYLFINVFAGPIGGLEHDHAAVMTIRPWQMQERWDYIQWLGLAAHEFFHAWNVRRMRPSALQTYDYDREVYTRELWLVEGLSSYYDNLLLFRAGLIQVAEYLDLLAEEVRNYELLPGRQVRSAEHASFDTWIKQYKPNENSLNSTVSYYRKGALIGFVTDTAIRRETRNRESLDSVLREMYVRFGPGQGAYPPGAFEDLVEEKAGPATRAFVENLLRSTADPDLDDALAWYGLILDRASGRTAEESGDQPPPADFGIVWNAAGPRLLADQVIFGHAAADAGVLPGDELLAIDGLRVGPDDYLDHQRRLRPGQTVELTLTRHGRLLTLPVRPQAAIPDRYRIVAGESLGRAERERLTAWLGRELRFLR
jgi:predicted metalloprotease with PDZ domain